jgi:hypothetical protein
VALKFKTVIRIHSLLPIYAQVVMMNSIMSYKYAMQVHEIHIEVAKYSYSWEHLHLNSVLTATVLPNPAKIIS